jgi:dihydropyrimidinase
MIHYAYARPGMKVLETLDKFRDDGLANSLTDFGLHAGIFDMQNQIKEIPAAFKLGVTSFKMFMAYAKLKWMTDDYWLMAALDTIGAEGGLTIVHAENGPATDYLEDKYLRMRLSGPEVLMRSCPEVLEAEAVNRLLAMSSVTSSAVYIPHISTARALAPICRARKEGQIVYAETCPHYLALTQDAYQKWGPWAKGGPPLRTPESQEALWRCIQDGSIDTIASDHLPKDKERNDDFFGASFGTPQAETFLTVLYQTGVMSGRITLPRLVQLLSETPARIFGYYPRKGTIAPGSDADLVILDHTTPFTIRHADQHSHGKYTLYEGWQCVGRPIVVMQRGQVLVDHGELVGKPGRARFMPTCPAIKGL